MNNLNLHMLLSTQDTLNTITQEQLGGNVSWRKMSRPWSRYIYQECAELSEALGGCHWNAAPEQSKVQTMLEVVDILQCALSDLLQQAFDHNVDTEMMSYRDEQAMPETAMPTSPLACCDLIVLRASTGSTTVAAVFALADRLGYSSSQLSRLYVAKAALNIHRAENGYATGEYAGREGIKDDNDVLEGLLRTHKGVVSHAALMSAILDDLPKILS